MRSISIFALLIITLVTGCKFDSSNDQANTAQGPLKYDTAKIAIITWGHATHIFDSLKYKPATLTQDDLTSIDSLIIVCITSHNDELNLPEQYKDYEIDLKATDYKRQLVAVTNSMGEKEVWINCLCRIRDSSWKTQIHSIKDGGPCYFNLKVNLTTRSCYDLYVNGLA
jgi:hypothetical protein